jgi:hypothetical protein
VKKFTMFEFGGTIQANERLASNGWDLVALPVVFKGKTT